MLYLFHCFLFWVFLSAFSSEEFQYFPFLSLPFVLFMGLALIYKFHLGTVHHILFDFVCRLKGVGGHAS